MLPALLLALSLVSGVDTRVGTAASASPTASIFGSSGEVFGNTIPCVTEPNGQTFWTPQTRQSAAKGVSPYYYGDDRCLGLRASHWLSGGATQDYGAFAILPADAPVPLDHRVETATPAYYALGPWEMTGRSHSAIFRFADCEYLKVSIVSEYQDGWIEIDTLAREIRAANPVHRIYQGKGKPAGFDGCLVVRYDAPAELVALQDGLSVQIRFRERGQHLVKAGTSFTSVQAAGRNLDAEIPGWDFEHVHEELEGIWERWLGRIGIKSQDEELRRLFYGSLWRTALLPRTASDCGEPVRFDDFSLWDTYRALHPLMTLLAPGRVEEMVTSLLDRFDRGGWLPTFPCWGSYTSAMIGDHAISVISDAYIKGIRGYDAKKAYAAMRRNAFLSPGGADYLQDSLYQDGRGRRSLQSYLQYGYIPLEDEVPFAYHSREQVSRTLEYAYDDWCLSRVALRRGRLRDYVALRRRSANWRRVFDPRTRWVQGRYADGHFLDEDNVLERVPFITEGTPCHYSWYVPHDIPALAEMMGGRECFLARLDSMFTQQRYWHGNEPCHQIAWMYSAVGEPARSQQVIRDILRSEYHDAPDGLCGNDDAGQMSAWYVFACLGFYPLCPGSGEYALAAPAVEEAVLDLDGGRQLHIRAQGLSGGRPVRRICFNGRTLYAEGRGRAFVSHRRLMRGGLLEFE